MAKQRFVVYKAINKNGEAERSLLVAGGKYMPFFGNIRRYRVLNKTTQQVMNCYGKSSYPTVKQWKQFARRNGATLIQKVIYFN